MKSKPKNPLCISGLSKQILAIVIVASSVAALAITGFQLLIDFQKDKAQVEQHLDNFKTTHLDIIAKALWEVNHPYIKVVVEGMMKSYNINYIDITEANGKIAIKAGDRKPVRVIERSYNLIAKESIPPTKIGVLFIQANLDNLIYKQLNRLLIILSTNIVKTLVVSFIILIFLNRILIKPLATIAAHLDKVRNDEPCEELDISNTSKVHVDNEIDNVVASINNLKKTLDDKSRVIERQTQELSQKILTQNKELHKAFEKKSTLLRLVCHDLNQPLTIVSMAAELLSNSDQEIDHDTEVKLLKRILTATAMGEKLIDQIRNLEAIDVGKKELEVSAFKLDNIIEHITFLYKERMDNKEITLETDIPLDAYIMVEAESFKTQVIGNLIGNAIKFSSSGNIISISAQVQDDVVEIQISDQGVGMSPDLLAIIFDPEMKTNRTGTSGETGTGFGMPLVKAFVENVKGSIEIRSKAIQDHPKDHGTTVVLTFRSSSQETSTVKEAS